MTEKDMLREAAERNFPDLETLAYYRIQLKKSLREKGVSYDKDADTETLERLVTTNQEKTTTRIIA